MSKILKIILAYVVSWMFFFPLSFTFLPDSINSKMLMAVLGVGFLWRDIVDRKSGLIAKQSVILMFMTAIVFSLICYATTVINNTDTADYITYFVSMVVWWAAAYASYGMIRYAHGEVNIKLIGTYIVMLCVGQGLISFSFYVSQPVYAFFSKFFNIQEATTKSGTRLFGLGTSADTGGIRYAISLVFFAYLMFQSRISVKEYILYSLSFFIIIVFGNMMARTTTVGAIIAILYILYKTLIRKDNIRKTKPLLMLCSVGLCLVPLFVLINAVFPQTADLYEFAFEGFYHYMETGDWSTSSTNILLDMWKIWPDSIKTWLIGDGLFLDPNDPTLYYMGTDVGYARFVFFCGLLGLSTFAVFFALIVRTLCERFPLHSELFLLLLIMVFAIWVKVTTDIFFVFALLLCLTPEDERCVKYEDTL